MSSQIIGAESDDLRITLRTKHGIALDVRDRNWFVERYASNVPRERASEELADAIVTPLLKSAGVGPRAQEEFSGPDAIAAITFLGLQWQDEVREKGLTKLTFEALVRSVLVNTSQTNRMTTGAIQKAVVALLPGHPASQVDPLVLSALRRLAKSTVKHWVKEDEYHLAHEEMEKYNAFQVELALAENALQLSIENIARQHLANLAVDDAGVSRFAKAVRVATDAVLFDKSQAFAMAVAKGSLAELADTDFSAAIARVISAYDLPRIKGVDWRERMNVTVKSLVASDDASVQAHLRKLSDSYTLMAFLKQTPDVQEAVGKMFSYGELWLDTSVLLPLIADTLLAADGEMGRFTRMIEAARDAGIKLFVTPGVTEEIERHMNRSLVCAQGNSGRWEGAIPFLFERYLNSGRGTSAFARWLENFRGSARPLEDLREYMEDQFGIKERSLENERNNASKELRHALEQIWYDRYERRRERYGDTLDQTAITRLVNHDVECYAGVVHLRRNEVPSPFGYSAWWLTVDRQAFDLNNKLKPLMNELPPHSPVMSADFLVNYLAFGPMRRRVSKTQESHLPLVMAFGSATHLTRELMAEAENLRASLKELPERLIRRKVRDYLDNARAKLDLAPV